MEVGTAFVSSASSLRQLVPRAKMNSARALWPIGCARPLWARLVLGLRRAGVTCFVICLAMQSVGGIARLGSFLIYAATGLDSKSQSCFHTAQAMRAILFARATAALFEPTLRSS